MKKILMAFFTLCTIALIACQNGSSSEIQGISNRDINNDKENSLSEKTVNSTPTNTPEPTNTPTPFIMVRRPPSSTLFPYPTLVRSIATLSMTGSLKTDMPVARLL